MKCRETSPMVNWVSVAAFRASRVGATKSAPCAAGGVVARQAKVPGAGGREVGRVKRQGQTAESRGRHDVSPHGPASTCSFTDEIRLNLGRRYRRSSREPEPHSAAHRDAFHG